MPDTPELPVGPVYIGSLTVDRMSDTDVEPTPPIPPPNPLRLPVSWPALEGCVCVSCVDFRSANGIRSANVVQTSYYSDELGEDDYGDGEDEGWGEEDDDENIRNSRGDIVYNASANALDYLSLKAMNAARNAGLRTYGIEIELCPESRNHRDLMLSTIYGSFGKRFLAKSDGSLDAYGIEVISAPAGFDTLRKWVSELFEAANQNGVELSLSSSCGTHVHQGRELTNPVAVAKFAAALRLAAISEKFGDPGLFNFWRALARRSPNNYCSYTTDPPLKVDTVRYTVRYKKKKYLKEFENGHYAAVSLSRHGTYEYRLFAGVRNARHACSAIEAVEWIHGMFSEVGARNLRSVGGMLHNLVENDDKYPNIMKRFEIEADMLAVYKPLLDEVRARRKHKRKVKGGGIRRSHEEAITQDASLAERVLLGKTAIKVEYSQIEGLDYSDLGLQQDALLQARAKALKMDRYEMEQLFGYSFEISGYPQDHSTAKILKDAAVGWNTTRQKAKRYLDNFVEDNRYLFGRGTDWMIYAKQPARFLTLRDALLNFARWKYVEIADKAFTSEKTAKSAATEETVSF